MTAMARTERCGSRLFRLPMPRPWSRDVTTQYLVVTEIETSDGAIGRGFTWTPQVGARAIQAMLDDDVRPFVVGRAASPEALWDTLWWHLREAGSGGVTTLAMAAVDIALWDLRAAAAGVSLVDFLGRRRSDVATYASGVNRHLSLAELEEQVQGWVDAGSQRMKIKVGLPDLDDDVARVSAVRRIIGPKRQLMLDANQLWDVASARQAMSALARFEPFWIEEPLPAEDLAAYARLRASIDVPVATGESLYTVGQFRDLLSHGCCDYVQPNICRVGGITPFLRIADLAHAWGVPTMPHLLPELSAQLAVCLPLPGLVEDVDRGSYAALNALAEPSGITLASGVAQVDTGPGHGLTFAVDNLEENTC